MNIETLNNLKKRLEASDQLFKKRKTEKQLEIQYWEDLKRFVDQEITINPDILDNRYFQDFLFYTYCKGRTNDPYLHLYVITEINRDYLHASWTEEKQEQAIASKKLAPYFPPVQYHQGTGRVFY